MTKRLEYAIQEKREKRSNFTMWDVMATDAAGERAKERPAPGDKWSESLCYYVHVEDVRGEWILVREYVAPCEVSPEGAKATWAMMDREFGAWMEGKCLRYDGSHNWVARKATDEEWDGAKRP